MTEVEDIIEKGYSQVQAKLIVKKMKFHRMSIDSFLKHYDDCFKTINNLGFSDNDIKNFFILEPRIIYLKDKFESRINNIKDKFLYNTKKDNNLIPRLIIYKEKTINDKYKHLINLGFTKAQIKKMTHNDTKLITRSKKSIKKIFNTFKSLYLNNQQIAKIFVIKSKDICMNSQ